MFFKYKTLKLLFNVYSIIKNILSKSHTRCIKNDIAIYSPHTACDVARGGVNDWIVKGLGSVKSSVPISPRVDDENAGMGRIAELNEPYPTLHEIVDRMKSHFDIQHLQLAVIHLHIIFINL